MYKYEKSLYWMEIRTEISVVTWLNDLFLLQVNVRVTTMDAELEFSFQPNTTGKQLFDQVCMWQLKRVYTHL